MTKKLKHILPAYSILDHFSLSEDTLNELINCVTELEEQFETTIEVNKKLCAVHNDLTHSSYSSFYQIGLTDSSADNQSITFEELDNINEALNIGTKTQVHRRKKKLSTEDNNPMNESTFTVKTPTYYKYQPLFDKILKQLKGTPTRIRLVKLKAGENITPHIDYDPSYSLRIIIPIIADSNCVNLFWVKNQILSTTFSPGKAYFLNTGFKHAVINYSEKDRYTLMITLKDLKDIEHLLT